MIRKSFKSFRPLFFGLALVDISFGLWGFAHLRVVSKPLIMLSLLYYFLRSGRPLEKPTYLLTAAALALSLFGDVFLLFEPYSNRFFILGLAAFLLAHLVYGLVFSRKWNTKPGPAVYLGIFLLIAFGTILFWYLKPSLSTLLIPVLAYVFAILFMAISALTRFRKVSSPSFWFVLIGALSFIASDSILAIDRFKSDIPLSNLWIMGSYALAQYMLVEGLLKQGRLLKN